MRRHLIALSLPLACLTLAACDDDAPSEPAEGGGGGGAPAVTLVGPVPAGQAWAGRVTQAAELVTGPAASGRLGDFVLVNARARFVVQDAGPSGAMVGLFGGNLVDADLVRADGVGRDALLEQVPVAGYRASDATRVEVESDGRDGGPAVVRAVARLGKLPQIPDIGLMLPDGPAAGIELVHRYVLNPDEAVLRLETTVRNTGAEAILPMDAGDAWMLGGRISPFVEGKGFTDASGGRRFGARAAGVSYATGTTSGEDYPLVLTITSVAAAVAASGDLPPGGVLRVERLFSVADGGVSNALAEVAAEQGEPLGAVAGLVADDAGGVVPFARVSFADVLGNPIGELEADASGSFAGRLPLSAGPLLVGASAKGRVPVPPSVPLTLAAQGEAHVDVTMGAPGTILARVTDGEGVRIPARLQLTSAAGEVERIALLPGENAVQVAPGAWHAVISRGFEFAFEEQELVVPSGGSVALEVELPRLFSTDGFLSGDFHLHSQGSVDSQLTFEERIAAVAAEGVEWAVNTEHDNVVDFAPVSASLGLQDFLHTTPGCEISTTLLGHMNAWPLPVVPDAGGDGAILWTGLPPGDIARAARTAGANVVQVNHPRHGQGLFRSIAFDPSTGLATRDPTELELPAGTDLNDLPFDALELFNGKRIDQLFGVPGEPGAYPDWVALIDRGRRVTFTGNSDSHTLSAEPGYPRNLVASGSDDPAAADVDALNEALRAGRVVVVAGPWVQAELRGEGGGVTGVGDVGRPGTLHVEVDAAPFVDVETVRVLERGVTELAVYTKAGGQVAAAPTVRRLAFDLPIAPAADTWFLIEAKSDQPMLPVYGDPPLTMTNPLYVDVAGDGWTPPIR